MPTTTTTPPLGQMFADVVRHHGAAPAQRIRIGRAWQTWTYAEFGARVADLAGWLVEYGCAPGDRVAIFSGNRPEWHVADFACLSSALISVPVFANSSADQVAHVLTDSGCRLVFVGSQREADLVRETGIDLTIVGFDVIDGATSLRECRPAAPGTRAEVERRRDAAILDDVVSIIYTSGTTGKPRGVMLTHRNFAYQIDSINGLYDVGPGDQSVCFLPLAHALERIWDYYVVSRAALNTFCTDPRRIAELLPVARPNLLISVPKLYEKVYATARQRVEGSPVRSAVLRWSLHVGGRNQRAYRKGRRPALALRLQLPVADRLVLRAVRDAVGGPKKILISGGAPLRPEVEEFFSACGLLLGQGYGLTESGPMMTYFSPTTFKLGTVGYCTPGGEIKIGSGGEILYRGPNVMRGYWQDAEATAAAIDDDGFLHTGDVGYLDAQGYLTITDRLKDIIVTSGGKNIAPQEIEGLLLTDPLFEYAVVLGNDRPYLTLLAQPTREGLEAIGHQLQLQWSSLDDLIGHHAVITEIQRRVADATRRLPSFEQIRDLRLSLDAFTQDGGTLTPTLKVKRREVERRFAALIDEMYVRTRR